MKHKKSLDETPGLRRATAHAPELPSILAVGFSKLGARFRDVAMSLQGEARIRVLAKGFDDAMSEIHALGEDQIDVIVSAGANGTYIKNHADVPTVLINVTGSDLLYAVSKARLISPTIGVVAHGHILPELLQLKAAFGLDLPCSTYVTNDDAEAAVLALRREGVDVIVGPGSVTTIAEQYGMAGVLLYSDASIRNAFLSAIDMARTRRAELRKRAFIDGILRNLRDGILALDADDKIQSINAAMFAVLGAKQQKLVGLAPSQAFPHVRWDTLIGECGKSTEAETLIAIGTQSYLAHSRPLLDPSGLAGRLITFTETSQLQRMERSVRSANTPRQLRARYVLDDLIHDSPALRRVKEYATQYAQSDATVLVTGESGTGKELVAQGMHNAGLRRDYPFVAVNCGGLSESLLESELFGYEDGTFTGARRGGKVGLIEAADHGTLFLDEVAEMPVVLQTRLLRVIQERQIVRVGAIEPTPVDIRVIAATHRDLRQEVVAGRFREDLFYRLNILKLSLPPLRARPEDIWPTLARMLEELLGAPEGQRCLRRVLTPWRDALLAYRWPGNVRELRNVAMRIAAHCGAPGAALSLQLPDIREIVPELFDAPAEAAKVGPSAVPRAAEPYKRALAAEDVAAALDASGGNRREACRRLGISRSTLWRKLRELQCDDGADTAATTHTTVAAA